MWLRIWYYGWQKVPCVSRFCKTKYSTLWDKNKKVAYQKVVDFVKKNVEKHG